MADAHFDLLVIGSGPAGEKGAAQAAYFGKRVALIEKQPRLGGALVNTGTIPSKTLRETALYFSGLRQRGLYGIDYTLRENLTIPQFIPFVGCFWVFINFPLQLVYYFYFIPYCVSKNGASIGKKMQKLRVVPLGNPGGRLELLPAILRQFGNFFALNLIVLAIKGDERISLSDMLAKSEVIKVDR